MDPKAQGRTLTEPVERFAKPLLHLDTPVSASFVTPTSIHLFSGQDPNGQFVVMDVPAGQTIKRWRGPAASQVKDPKMGLDAHLEGGWDQVIIKPEGPDFDTTTFYRRSGTQGTKLELTEMTYADYKALPEAEKALYAPVREKINHPDIKGPYDTHWGSTDFDAQWTGGRLGLPELPGQMTN